MQNLSESINSFINYCKFEKNLTNKTLKAYTIDLNQFISFIKEKYSLNDILGINKDKICLY